MLHPEMIVPFAVSTAAPTLKPEKSATACSRAARAAATSWSEPANDALQQRDELPFHLLRGLDHFRMMQRLREDAGRGIRDARDAQHFDAHVSRRNGFRHRRHADRIGAERAKRANLRRSLVTRPEDGDVNAVLKGDAKRRGRLVGDRAQALRIHVGHVGKAQAEPIVVRPDQRIAAEKVDVIVDHHQGAARAIRADAAGGVGQDQPRHAEAAHGSHRERHGLHVVAFVDVDAAGERQHFLARQLAGDQLAGMPHDARGREMRNVAVRNGDRAAEMIREVAESRTEHDGDIGVATILRPQPLGGFGRLFECTHNKKPTMMAVTKLASVPASIARKPSRARSLRRVGASAPMPPICMPIDAKFANPQSAKVAMVNERGSSESFSAPSCAKAMNSLSTMRVPSRLPIAAASRHGTPRLHATGANTQPKIICIDKPGTPIALPRAPRIPLSRKISATNEISMAPTFIARCRPSAVPRPAASITLTSVFSICSLTVPRVSGVSVSGTNILAIISVPGAVMITAVSRWRASMPNAM